MCVYDYVLWVDFPQPDTLIGYIDSIALVVIDKHPEDIIWRYETATRLINVLLLHLGEASKDRMAGRNKSHCTSKPVGL